MGEGGEIRQRAGRKDSKGWKEKKKRKRNGARNVACRSIKYDYR